MNGKEKPGLLPIQGRTQSNYSLRSTLDHYDIKEIPMARAAKLLRRTKQNRSPTVA